MIEASGTVIAHYRIDDLIGAGGMGTVYKAYDLNLSRPVALKLMHPEIATLPQFRERLKAEAQTAANLDHPSIVKIYNFGETDEGQLYVAMEQVKDGSLSSHLQRVRRKRAFLDIPLALQITIQIADALDYAHQAGVIHRDVKPANLILKQLSRTEEAGFAAFRAILTDFGLVQILDGTRITQSGMTMGTPIYMSPEQCEGESLDGRSDLYSLGVVLYEMLAGRPPFEFASLSQAVAAHVREKYPPPVREVRNEVPPLIDALLSRLLAKNRDDRFETGKEVADALRTAFFSISETPTSWWTLKPRADSAEIELVPPLEGDQLIVRTMGRGATDSYALTKMRYAIGRSGDNDLVLASGEVSRHHARLEHGLRGWMLRPLVGINGTLLNGERQIPDQQQLLKPGEPISIGPYEIWISPAGAPILEPIVLLAEPSHYAHGATIIAAPEDAPTQTMRREVAADEAEDTFGLYIAPRSAEVEPGRSVEFVLEILNRSAIDDRVRLEIGGIPQTWVDLSKGFTPLPAGERVELRFRITPPRSADTSHGRQRFRIELEAQRNANKRPSVKGELNISTFEAFDVVMTPRELRLPETVAISIMNKGNQTAEYAIVARESEDRIKFVGERGRVRIQSGQTVDVELELDARVNSLFSAEAEIPYEIEVRSSSGAVQVQHGNALTGSRLLPMIKMAGMILLTTLCALTLLFGYPALFGRRGEVDPSENTIPVGIGQQSPTPLSVIVLETPTPINTPVLIANNDPTDLDGDGLSDSYEAIVGSSPTLADTDGDRLDDRVEVFETGTQPTLADSDGDGLNDGDEVLIHRTSPILRDSDGDGIDDATEIAQGSNPLFSEATATTEGTVAPAPTALPTVIPVPSATQLIGEVATDTPVPVDTATAAPATVTPDPTATVAIPATSTTMIVVPIPTVTLTVAPTTLATETPVATPTLIFTPTLTATLTSVPLEPTATTIPLSGIVLSCAAESPTIDGQLSASEWDAYYIGTGSTPSGDETIDFATSKDSSTLYFAVEIADTGAENSDSLRIYIDTNKNGGDPDAADRYVRIGYEAGVQQIWRGIGSNEDGDSWDVGATDLNENWQVAIERTAAGWTVEIAITIADEVPELGSEFSVMVQMLFTGVELVNWPDSAESEQASTWQLIDNSHSCE